MAAKRRPWDKPPQDWPTWLIIGATIAILYVVVWLAYMVGQT